jgi:hypothetical protein
MEDPLTRRWRRSRRCSSGACVEVAVAGADVAVRNSTTPQVVISFSRAAFRDLVEGLKQG